MTTDILVVGAGISGLVCALLLTDAGHSVRVLESRSVPGGRIRSLLDLEGGQYLGDLGPTWVWPKYQERVQHWSARLGLELYSQFNSGDGVYDSGPSQAVQHLSLPGQIGIRKILGGPQAIIQALVRKLPKGTLICRSRVKSIVVHSNFLELSGEEQSWRSQQVIIATPPRVARQTIRWEPPLSRSLSQALSSTPTWMASQAKAVVTYDKPFWRELGLSGRIASRSGPIVEGHDHCGPDGTPAAIFGFLGWPHKLRAELGQDLQTHIFEQMKRCFGQDSPNPLAIHVEDWATDPLVATPKDLIEEPSHPITGPSVLREGQAEGRIWFAGSETSNRSPGLIEGAFDSAERTVKNILACFAHKS